MKIMQLYSHIHCFTKTGVEVWSFYKLNSGYHCSNGVKTLSFTSYKALKEYKATMLGYKTKTGARRFYPGLPKSKEENVIPLPVEDTMQLSLAV